MGRDKQIQISTKTFIDIYRLIIALDDYELDYGTKALVKSLEKAVEGKFEAMEKRKAFSEYKTAEPDTEDREVKRKRYLELAGVHHDWISQEEISL